MLIFGVDVPLVEIILVFSILIFILFVETVFVLVLLIRQMNKTKKLGDQITRLSETILGIKKKEIEELDKLKK